MDAQLRQCFFEAPEEITAQESYEISRRELRALLHIDEHDLEVLSAKMNRLARPTAAATDAVRDTDGSTAAVVAARPELRVRQ